MEHKKLELFVLRLFKKTNNFIFETVFQYHEKKNFQINKMKDTYSFTISSPTDLSKFLMIGNFPDESGYVQTAVVRSQMFDELRIIKSFEELIDVIEEFTYISNTPNSCGYPRDYPDNLLEND